jgi:hypothetical protein
VEHPQRNTFRAPERIFGRRIASGKHGTLVLRQCGLDVVAMFPFRRPIHRTEVLSCAALLTVSPSASTLPRSRSHVKPWPAIEGAFMDISRVIKGSVISEAISLIDDCP